MAAQARSIKNYSPNLKGAEAQSIVKKLLAHARCSGAAQLLRVYVTCVPRLLWRCSIGVMVSPRRTLQLLHEVLNFYDLIRPDRHLRSVELLELLPPDAASLEIEIKGNYQSSRPSDTCEFAELTGIACLVRAIGAHNIFEFGTNVGRMTRLLALNAPAASVFTLDLAQELVRHKVGECYLGKTEAQRITQLSGDSLEFDPAPYSGRMDFCWVDASHGYPYVMSDSLAAIRMVRPGGWVAWHDYRHTAWWSGVTRVVRRINCVCGGDAIFHLKGTTIALMRVSEEVREKSANLCSRGGLE